jgi:hypothetical protein
MEDEEEDDRVHVMGSARGNVTTAGWVEEGRRARGYVAGLLSGGGSPE